MRICSACLWGSWLDAKVGLCGYNLLSFCQIPGAWWDEQGMAPGQFSQSYQQLVN